MKRMYDLTGQKFNRLMTIRPTEERSGTSVVWECLCDCGVVTYVRATDLVKGRIKSCGCLRNEKSAERIKANHVSGPGRPRKNNAC